MDKDWAEAFLEEVAEIPFIDYKDHKKRWMDLFNSYMRKVRRETKEEDAVIAEKEISYSCKNTPPHFCDDYGCGDIENIAKAIRESEGKV